MKLPRASAPIARTLSLSLFRRTEECAPITLPRLYIDVTSTTIIRILISIGFQNKKETYEEVACLFLFFFVIRLI